MTAIDLKCIEKSNKRMATRGNFFIVKQVNSDDDEEEEEGGGGGKKTSKKSLNVIIYINITIKIRMENN